MLDCAENEYNRKHDVFEMCLIYFRRYKNRILDLRPIPFRVLIALLLSNKTILAARYTLIFMEEI